MGNHNINAAEQAARDARDRERLRQAERQKIAAREADRARREAAQRRQGK